MEFGFKLIPVYVTWSDGLLSALSSGIFFFIITICGIGVGWGLFSLVVMAVGLICLSHVMRRRHGYEWKWQLLLELGVGDSKGIIAQRTGIRHYSAAWIPGRCAVRSGRSDDLAILNQREYDVGVAPHRRRACGRATAPLMPRTSIVEGSEFHG